MARRIIPAPVVVPATSGLLWDLQRIIERDIAHLKCHVDHTELTPSQAKKVHGHIASLVSISHDERQQRMEARRTEDPLLANLSDTELAQLAAEFVARAPRAIPSSISNDARMTPDPLEEDN